MWTLDELLDRVSAALTAEYSGAPNGRVRDVPDRRAVRWYATTGLVDRPSAMRGRTALYEKRHLLQLVAVKRLQSEGRTLADIQAELTGATEATLTAIARVPAHLLDAGVAEPAGEVRPRFWAAPAGVVAAPATQPTEPRQPAERAGAVGAAADAPASHRDPGTATAPAASAPSPTPAPPAPPLLTGVPLPGGAFLLLPGTPTEADRADIAAAAQPLLDLLAARGLLTEREPS